MLRQTGDSSSAALLRDESGEIAELVASGLPGDHDLTTDYSGGDAYLPIRGTKPVEGSKTDVDGTILLVSYLPCHSHYFLFYATWNSILVEPIAN